MYPNRARAEKYELIPALFSFRTISSTCIPAIPQSWYPPSSRCRTPGASLPQPRVFCRLIQLSQLIRPDRLSRSLHWSVAFFRHCCHSVTPIKTLIGSGLTGRSIWSSWARVWFEQVWSRFLKSFSVFLGFVGQKSSVTLKKEKNWF